MRLENTPTLDTSRLILRKFTKYDVDDILLIYSDEEVNKFLPWFPIRTIEEARAYLNNVILPQYEKEAAYSFAIELKETSHVIGYIHIDKIGLTNDIGYGIAKAYWHKGYATEAVNEVINHLKKVNFPYITATHDINNPNSGGVMKKVGMTYCYTYHEVVQPKNYLVTFRMYQLNLDADKDRIILEYWNKYDIHYIEDEPK